MSNACNRSWAYEDILPSVQDLAFNRCFPLPWGPCALTCTLAGAHTDQNARVTDRGRRESSHRTEQQNSKALGSPEPAFSEFEGQITYRQSRLDIAELFLGPATCVMCKYWGFFFFFLKLAY